DAVLCNAVLEHDPQFWRTLGEIGQVLKPGGLFVVGVPGYGAMGHTPFRRLIALLRYCPGFARGMGLLQVSSATLGLHDFPGDYYRFSKQAVTEVFLAGYERIEAISLLMPPACIGWGHKPSVIRSRFQCSIFAHTCDIVELADNCIVKRETTGRRNASSFIPYPDPTRTSGKKVGAQGVALGGPVVAVAGCRSATTPILPMPVQLNCGSSRIGCLAMIAICAAFIRWPPDRRRIVSRAPRSSRCSMRCWIWSAAPRARASISRVWWSGREGTMAGVPPGRDWATGGLVIPSGVTNRLMARRGTSRARL